MKNWCVWLIYIVWIIPTTSAAETEVVRPGSSASHHLPIETHHSLHHPFDVSMPYWKYGGSTVCTQSFIRLTPNAQSRQGWIFNEFELQSNNWEIELHFEVKSDYHIGGDGMGLFVLPNRFHPRYNRDHNHLSGSIFGLIEDFTGFGVILDTYDNDGNKDNPGIYVLKQERDKLQTWNNDNDFIDNMVKNISKKENAYQCTNNYRNSDNHRMILRYLNNELHVYVKSINSDEYEYCLSVKIGMDTKGFHIVLTAMTGQVADKHDIFLLSTRYLDSKDMGRIDDSKIGQIGYSRGRKISVLSILFWILIAGLNIFLIYEIIMEYYTYNPLRAHQLNDSIWWANVIHFIIVILVVLYGNWTYLLINLPFIGWRGYQYMTNNTRLDPIKLRKARNILDVGQPIGSIIKLIVLLISIVMSIYKIFNN